MPSFYCLFCYKKCQRSHVVTRLTENTSHLVQTRFVPFLERYLGIDNSRHEADHRSGRNGEDDGGGGVCQEISLPECLGSCLECSEMLTSFCDLYHELKCTELRILWTLSKLSEVVCSANGVTTRRQEFHNECLLKVAKDSKEGSSDGRNVLRRLAVLRKQLANRDSDRLRKENPRLTLKRLPGESRDATCDFKRLKTGAQRKKVGSVSRSPEDEESMAKMDDEEDYCLVEVSELFLLGQEIDLKFKTDDDGFDDNQVMSGEETETSQLVGVDVMIDDEEFLTADEEVEVDRVDDNSGFGETEEGGSVREEDVDLQDSSEFTKCQDKLTSVSSSVIQSSKEDLLQPPPQNQDSSETSLNETSIGGRATDEEEEIITAAFAELIESENNFPDSTKEDEIASTTTKDVNDNHQEQTEEDNRSDKCAKNFPDTEEVTEHLPTLRRGNQGQEGEDNSQSQKEDDNADLQESSPCIPDFDDENRKYSFDIGSESEDDNCIIHFQEQVPPTLLMTINNNTKVSEGGATSKKYFCIADDCNERFPTERELKYHTKLHGMFPCQFCSEVESFAPNLALHELKQHCGTDIKEKNKLSPSAKTNDSKEEIMCIRCTFTTHEQSLYVEHHLRTHLGCLLPQKEDKQIDTPVEFLANGDREDMRFQCTFSNCTASFLLEKEMEFHTTMHGKFSCVECEISETFAPDLAVHELSHHCTSDNPDAKSKAKRPADVERFVCRRCSYYSEERSTYIEHHLKKHLGLKEFSGCFISCPVCQQQLRRGHFPSEVRENIATHLKQMHNILGMKADAIQRCGKCPAYFTTRAYLSSHQNLAHQDKPGGGRHQCSECGKALKHKSQLRMHMLKVHKKRLLKERPKKKREKRRSV